VAPRSEGLLPSSLRSDSGSRGENGSQPVEDDPEPAWTTRPANSTSNLWKVVAVAGRIHTRLFESHWRPGIPLTAVRSLWLNRPSNQRLDHLLGALQPHDTRSTCVPLPERPLIGTYEIVAIVG
jgi:hypothetical protein